MAAEAASREGNLAKSNGLKQVAIAGCQAIAIGYAALVACFTMLPSRVDSELFVIDVNELMNPRIIARLALVGGLSVGLMLAVAAWRRRHVWQPRVSWPLLGWLAFCLIGLAWLVLISQRPRFLARHGLGMLASNSGDFDTDHMVFYVGFAVVAAVAWRDRMSLPALGVVLMTYGCLLELGQLFVPTRTFLVKDMVSNGLGIVLGLSWIYLYDSLFGTAGTRLSRLDGRRYQGQAGGRSTRASVQPRGP
jgi:hypothetical protein